MLQETKLTTMNKTIKLLQDHSIVLCSLKNKALLGENTHQHSVGWGNFAPVMAHRMNLIAEGKSPEFAGHPLEFMVINPEQRELSINEVDNILDDIMETTLRRPNPTLWVLTPHTVILQLMGAGFMSCPDACYFENNFPSEETRPYEIYLNGTNYRARLLYEDQIFEIN